MMQVASSIRAFTWFSLRRHLEENITDLHKCTKPNHIKQIHAQLIKCHLHQDPYIAPKLIASYSLTSNLSSAVNVFNQVPDPNVHLYNYLIRAYSLSGNESNSLCAFRVFLKMQVDGVLADNFTYPFLLKGCIGSSWLSLVKMVHAHVEKLGFYWDVFVPNSLIDCYCRCGDVEMAMKVFSGMEERDVVSWNSMVGGLVKNGDLDGALKVFDEMPEKDRVSWNTILDGFTKAGEMDKAFKLFERMAERDIVSWSTMVCGYNKNGDMDMARMLFDRCPVKNLVLWTTIISGYAEKGQVKEAMKLCDEMEKSGLRLDDGFFISILAACAESGMLGLGKKMHDSFLRSRFRCSTKALNSFIDMYAKCGCVDDAFRVFNGMEKDLVSWNSMIHGFGIHGHGEKSIELFNTMVREGFKPDRYTFIGLLCACTHAGLVNEGRGYFYSMQRVYGIVPQIEHYGCMVDLLGRGGHLKEAFWLVRSMPFEPNAIILGTLLGACRMHNDVKLATSVSKYLFKLVPSDPGIFSLLSNIYAQAGDWINVAKVRKQMNDKGGQKPSGVSSIEVEEEVHEFTVRDWSHPKSGDIYNMIDRLVHDLRQVGYVPRLL